MWRSPRSRIRWFPIKCSCWRRGWIVWLALGVCDAVSGMLDYGFSTTNRSLHKGWCGVWSMNGAAAPSCLPCFLNLGFSHCKHLGIIILKRKLFGVENDPTPVM
jgi:hypothetical protein